MAQHDYDDGEDYDLTGASRWAPAEYKQRPRELDLLKADEIVMRLENGEMLPDICDSRDMPMPGTFRRWCAEEPELEKRYQAARRIAADLSVDAAVAESFRTSDARLAKVRSDALFRHAEKSLPERYGNRLPGRDSKPDAEEPGAGVDYQALLLRKLEDVASRQTERARAAEQS